MTRGDRRLAAIMFTDMVGSTALGQRNESLSLALTDEQRGLIRPILARHGGREIKTMGDAFLVEFPDALNSVRCAYDIQRATREFNISLPTEKRIHLRIGLHLGDVVESQGDISGDAVNVASRIESLSEDGGVCMTRHVYDQVSNKFELPLVSLGPKNLKNVASPIEVYKMVLPWEQPTEGTSVFAMNRIAVLPFANFSPDPSDEYFANGITDEIISAVSGISGLGVISRTSVMGYRGSTKNLGEIGRELEVGTVLEGSFKKSGNRIRVTTQLISVSDDRHLWAQNYDRNLDDVFEVQSDIAKRVAESLRVRILPNEEARIERAPTSNKEAYSLYLKGREYWNERTKESIERSIVYFNEAVEKDAGFALANAGLADAYTIMLDNGYMEAKVALEKCREYARRALELDPSLAEAHVALAGYLQHSLDWSGAERELRKAIELNPNLSRAHHWLAVNFEALELRDEAILEYDKALALDPLSKVVKGVAAYSMVLAGKLDEGMEMAKDVVREFPDSYWGHISLGFALLKKSSYEEAVSEAKKGVLMLEGHPWPVAFYAYVLRKVGRLDEATAFVNNFLSSVGNRPMNLTQLAMVHLSIGETEKAFQLLDEAVKTSDPALLYLGWPPIFDEVRPDPRYVSLVKKVKPSLVSSSL